MRTSYKKKIEVEQLSLFENPSGPTAAQFKDQLIAEFRAQKGAYLQEAKKKRKRNRADSIFLPEDQRAYQDSFTVQPVYPYPDWCFPQVSTKPEDVKGLIRQAALSAGAGVPNVRLGLDFEFNPDKHKISIIGVASSVFAAACKWDDSFLPLLYAAVDAGVVFVGHWVLGADKFELENAARESGLAEILTRPNGYWTPRGAWLDSMGLHWLTSQALCKAPSKTQDDEGSLGYMGIWSAAHLHTDLPCWKACRGSGCTGPCPRCRVFDYCAIDAYGGLIVAEKCLEKMKERNIPYSLYETWAARTEAVCLKAERRGVRIDTDFIKGFDKKIAEKKETLFPKEGSSYKYFNPKSGKQVLDYFGKHGVSLYENSTERNAIIHTLEVRLKNEYGINEISEFESSTDQILLQDVDQMLYNLYLYKTAGKGAKAWFDEKYIKYDSYGDPRIHPRLVTTGTSTGRLSSSAPNAQNVPQRGWGAEIKKALLPEQGFLMAEVDGAQLELRVVLDNCGVSHTEIGGDAFTWLVEQSRGGFDKAAEIMSGTARDVAKRVSHASSYLEGFSLYPEWKLQTKRIHQQIKDGSLIIFEDWIFDNQVVGFTGANLAQSLFGDKTDISRRKALNIQFGMYFKNFPMIHQWHRRLSKQVELGWIQSRCGRYLELLDSPSSNMKAGAAFIGQSEGADFMQEKMVRHNELYPANPMALQVHDSLLITTIDSSWSNDFIKKDFFGYLYTEDTSLFPGLHIPFKVKVGKNWGELRTI